MYNKKLDKISKWSKKCNSDDLKCFVKTSIKSKSN